MFQFISGTRFEGLHLVFDATKLALRGGDDRNQTIVNTRHSGGVVRCLCCNVAHGRVKVRREPVDAVHRNEERAANIIVRSASQHRVRIKSACRHRVKCLHESDLKKNFAFAHNALVDVRGGTLLPGAPHQFRVVTTIPTA
jgi:hypothetical protein